MQGGLNFHCLKSHILLFVILHMKQELLETHHEILLEINLVKWLILMGKLCIDSDNVYPLSVSS